MVVKRENEAKLTPFAPLFAIEEKCPECGGGLVETRKISFSFADLIGASLLVAALITVLFIFIKAIGWIGLLVAVPLLALIVFVVIGGWYKKLSGYPLIGGSIWDQAGVIGGILFLIWVVIRYFIRFKIIKQQSCSQCGFHKRRE